MPKKLKVIKETNYRCPTCGTLHKTHSEASECMEKHVFPRVIKMYLHGCKETNYQTMDEMGIKEEDENYEDFRDNFIYALYEVELDVEVDEHGNTKILTVDGRTLSDKPPKPEPCNTQSYNIG